jgi:hypothetical protein
MLSTSGRRAALAAVVLIAGATACSIASKHGASTTSTLGQPVRLGATFHARAHLTGAIDVAGAYTVDYRTSDPKRNSCSGIAHAPPSGASFVIPLPTALGAYHVSGIASASPFHGAGTYETGRFAGMHLMLTKPGGATGLQFAATRNSRVHLMVAANGSGAFDFENLAGEPSGSLSGTVRWTCS